MIDEASMLLQVTSRNSMEGVTLIKTQRRATTMTDVVNWQVRSDHC
jgi:hypothetical protein